MEHGGGAGGIPGHRRVIHTVVETGSTNADMVALARTGELEGSWLRADRQTAGRGRQGRAWVSPPGNLYASTLVRLGTGDPMAATLALMAAVALEETVRSVATVSPSFTADGDGWAGCSLMLKWPNDLLLDGAKLSGILLERIEDAVVIGIGVNLVHHPELPDRLTTSLAAHGIDVDPPRFLDTLSRIFAIWLDRWRGEGMSPVRERWLARAHPVGTRLTVNLPDGVVLDGTFDGMETTGALAVRLASGERRVVHAGDVFLL